ncbi:hypothetical protein T190820D02B_11291 [Tenacibaculum sp. 190524A05c]
MKAIKTILFMFFIVNSVFSQQKIDSNSWLLAVSNDEKYVAYFKSNNDEPDEYIEGNIYIYNIENNSISKVDNETYIYDFLKVIPDDLGGFYMSTGDEVMKIDFFNGQKRKVFNTNDNESINGISLSEDNDCLVIVLEKDLNNDVYQKIILLDLKGKDNLLTNIPLHFKKTDRFQEDICAFINSTNIKYYIKNFKHELIEYDLQNDKYIVIDENVLKLLVTSENYIYYQKENGIIEYDIVTNEKTVIIESEKISLSFFKVNGKKIFLCLNDNIFIYDKEKESFKNLKQLGKRNFKFFGKKIALLETDNNSLSIFFNSNK